MFLEFFQLWDEPFGVTPDPAYLYPSTTHLAALDSLRNGILGGRGFMTLIAEPGMGKTTLLYQLIEQMPQTTRTAYLFQTQCNSLEFMQYLLSEVGVDPAGMGLVAMHRRFNEMLFNEMVHGKQFVLIVDESQNLSNAVLETIRLALKFRNVAQQIVADRLSRPARARKQVEAAGVVTATAARHGDGPSRCIFVRGNCGLHTPSAETGWPHGPGPFRSGRLGSRLSGEAKAFHETSIAICHAALSQAQVEQVRVVTAAIVEKSNRGLGSTIEELQRSRFAARPRPSAFDERASAIDANTAGYAKCCRCRRGDTN